MSSTTEIANLALSHLGVGKQISDLTADRSQEALAIKRFYDLALRETLREGLWPFTRKFATLGLVASNPTDEWDFSYRYPSDCLDIRRIISGTRNDSRQTRVAFLIGQDSTGLLIYTDQDSAEMEYTAYSNDPGIYPSDFTLAFSLKLAYYTAPLLTRGDPFKIRESVMAQYRVTMSSAAANAYNEEQPEEEPESEFIRARDS